MTKRAISTFLPRPTKREAIQKKAGIMVKSEKRLGAIRKELKERAVKFHKSSEKFWEKANLQSKNTQKCAAAT